MLKVRIFKSVYLHTLSPGLSILFWKGLLGHLLSLPSQSTLLQSSHRFLQYFFALQPSHSILKHVQHCFPALILFGGNSGAEIARMSYAGLSLDNEAVICDGPATILGWAELTSMLSCDDSRKSPSTSI